MAFVAAFGAALVAALLFEPHEAVLALLAVAVIGLLYL